MSDQGVHITGRSHPLPIRMDGSLTFREGLILALAPGVVGVMKAELAPEGTGLWDSTEIAEAVVCQVDEIIQEMGR